MVIQPRHGGKEVRGLVHFQQIIDDTNGVSGTSRGITFTKVEKGKWTATGTSTYDNIFRNLNYEPGFKSHIVQGHLYVIPCNTNPNLFVAYAQEGTGGSGTFAYFNSVNVPIRINPPTTGTAWFRLQIDRNVGVTVDDIIRPMAFDLTAMFADCPELTPTSIDEFKALFPADYYPYTAEPYDVII